MLTKHLHVALFPFILTACAQRYMVQPVPNDHPASPLAPVAPYPGAPPTLRPEPQDAMRTQPLHHDEHQMKLQGHPMGSESRMNKHDHGVHAAETGTKPEAKEPGATAGEPTYTCPMHPEVLQRKPGTCPKCGMKLIKKKEELR